LPPEIAKAMQPLRLEDLLKRDFAELDTSLISSYLDGRRVLVTGAGGSIGSEIARQLTRFNPKVAVLLDKDENSIHAISRQLADKNGTQKFICRLGDIRDMGVMARLFESYDPEVVLHTAAYKHVALVEENPAQSVFNNVMGTKNLIDLSLKHDVKHFINISTDKAVYPSSVMGVSKRVGEYIVAWGSARASPSHFYVSVRFGNVLGSTGSIIPIFKEQIQNGGPVTITHPDMARYFMTIPEATQLVLQAGGMGRNGSLFVLDMGDPIKIVDLARHLIRLSGLVPEKDIKIAYVGMKPGEKIFEEMYYKEEEMESTGYKYIFAVKKVLFPRALVECLRGLVKAAIEADSIKIKKHYRQIEPTYRG